MWSNHPLTFPPYETQLYDVPLFPYPDIQVLKVASDWS
jgi:hypothetical protein